MNGGGIYFPVRDAHGNTSHQFKPDHPRLRDGEHVKYETAPGTRLVVHCPRRVRQYIKDRGVPLWITEGVKKVLAGVGAGLCVVGLMGVDGWKVRIDAETSIPLPDWDEITLDVRIVFIAFDSDVMTKPEVRGALNRLAAFLRGRGATVVPVVIPHGANGEKQGLDDFIVAGGNVGELMTDALRSAIATPKAGTDGAQTCTKCPELQAKVRQFEDREIGLKTLRERKAWSGKQQQWLAYEIDQVHRARKEGESSVKLYLPDEGK